MYIRNKRFTLIELIVVIVLMGMLLTLALPAFSRMAVGSTVEAGLRTFSAKLTQARQVAITEHQYVALIMPDEEDLGDDNSHNYSCYRVAKVKRSGESDFTFSEWLDGSSWNYLPNGAYIQIREGGCDIKIDGIFDTANQQIKPLETIDEKGQAGRYVKAIVLQPNGIPISSISGPVPEIKIGEGYWSGTKLDDRGKDNNFFTIKLNKFTGRREID